MTIADVVERLRGCRRLLFVTGAGMSADSGLPTYRGIGGLYEDVKTEEGMAIEDALSGAMLAARPELCWRHIMQIEEACRGAAPNPGHHAIARLESRFEVVVLTQNVDGLHRAAGSKAIIDIHGDVRQLLCTACDHERTVSDYSDLACPPRCPSCGAVIRPDVVLFGEMLPLHKVARLRAELSSGFDAIFSVGTSSLFPYIAEPVVLGRRTGAFTVEINPARTVVSDAVDVRLEMGASDALTAIEAALFG
jgi:NAD-dependent deacetylase